MQAIFYCPFDSETRQMTLPEAPEGQNAYEISYTQLEGEADGKIKTLIIADEAIIKVMKVDERFEWVEDVETVAEEQLN